MFRVLDLFSGLGGFSLGLERTGGFETVAFCEIDPFCRKVLNKHWPDVPIYEDVKRVTSERLSADGIAVDVITGGFPCQDISVAGKRAGLDGERSGLWSELHRIIGEVRPRYALVENTTGLLSSGMGVVLGGLADIGFDAEWHVVPASAVGASHHRARVWLAAYPSTFRQNWRGRLWSGQQEEFAGLGAGELWERRSQPMPVGILDGVSNRMDRIGALGNAVVPQIPELIGNAILKAEGVT